MILAKISILDVWQGSRYAYIYGDAIAVIFYMKEAEISFQCSH